MSVVHHYFRVALRKLIRHRLFTVAVISTLAVGIGTNTAIFSVVDAVLLRPLPYPESDRLVWINFTAPGLGFDDMPLSDAVYLYLRERNRTLEDMALFAGAEFNLSGEWGALRVAGARVTPGLFSLLRMQPVVGRSFTTADGEPGAEPVVIVSHGLWSTRFGEDPSVLDRAVMIDGVAHRVVGIAPQGFGFPDPENRVWLPLKIDPANLQASSFAYPSIGRLRAGETPASARADIARLARNIGELVPDLTPAVVEKAGFSPVVRKLKERVVGSVRQTLWILLASGAFVLVVAFVNVANLFVARAEGRRREFALRTSLGASRADLLLLTFSESLLLAAIGGVLGFALAVLAVDALLTLAPAAVPRAHEVGPGASVLSFALAASVLTGILLAVVPVARFRSLELSAELKEGGRGLTPGRSRVRFQSVLVTLQVALTLVLLIGAGLMTRTFQAIRSVDPGFDADGVLTFDIALPPLDYPTAERAALFWRELTEHLETLPGARSAAVTSSVPLGPRASSGSIIIEDHPIPEGELMPIAARNYVTPRYFETLGIPLLRGRSLTATDGANGFYAVVVNESFARRWWPDGDALGRRIRESSSDPWYEVVGVVGDVRSKSLEEPAGQAVYFPILTGSSASPRTRRTMSAVLRADGDPTALVGAIRERVRALDPHLPIARVRPLASLVNDSMARTSFILVVLGIGAIVTMLLATVGIYAIVSHVAAQRSHELGVRMAFGATVRDVHKLVLRQGLALATVGVVVGTVAAFGLSRLLAFLLFGVEADDALTFGVAAIGMLGVAGLASYLPAHRASRSDPMEILRQE